MRRPKALMACANYWHSPFQVGSHHLARGLVRSGWDVAFISDPISPLHLVNGISRELRERYRIYRHRGMHALDGRLWAYTPGAFASPHNRPILRSEWLHRNWSRLSVPGVTRVVREQGFQAVDLLYIDSVNQRFWLDAIPHARSVFRVADRNSGHDKFTPAMQAMEREIARAVDTVVYTAVHLRQHVEMLGARHALSLPNGVNFQHFAGATHPHPKEFATIPKPIAVYVGAMEAWFDFGLVNAAVRRLPQVSFVLIGPEHMAIRKLKPAPNLHLLGRRPYSELPLYLRHADVGMIPLDVANHGELVHTVNPLKLYEYLASGLPVVASDWDELRTLASPAVLCRTADEFAAGIEEACASKPDRQAMLDYASRADWRFRVEALLQSLDLPH